MARRQGSRSPWLQRASEAVILASVLPAVPAHAEADADNETGDITKLIDRTRIRSAVAVDALRVPAAEGVALILSVEVNGMHHGLAQFRMIGNELWATRSVLGELGLRVDEEGGAPDELLALAETLDADVHYDPNMQAVSLMVEVSRLAVGTTRLNFNDQSQPVAESATGALLNYDVAATYSGGSVAFDAFTETRLFSGNVLLENTTLFQLGGGDGRSDRALRLDSTLSWSLPEHRLTVRAGDIITRATGWSRATRIGGVRIGTDFALQPYLVTAPIPAFYGDAALPSTVDLYIDGLKRFSGEVAPGPFEIGAGANRINGAGDAQLVVTDALGQVTTLDYPIYDTPTLLREGLSDWSLEAGAVREDYGLKSFAYGKAPVGSASYRRGISDAVTVEAHAEASKDLLNGGLGASALLPFGGVVTGSVATSRSEGRSGTRVEAGYSFIQSDFNLSATVQRSSEDYRDLAALDGARVPRARDVVTAGYNSASLGSFGASFVRQRQTGEETRSFLSLNWFRSLGDRFTLSVTAHQDLSDRSDRGVFATLTFTPRSREHFSAGFQASERRTSASASFRRSLPYEGGTGFAGDVLYDGQLRAAAQVDHLTDVGQATAGARLQGRGATAYAAFSGALVAMGDGIFPSRKVFDGFAVVSTSGVGDVPVMLQNREIGRTNGDGRLLVTGLNAYQENKVTIDTSDLSPNLWVEEVVQQAVPSQRSGALVDFHITPIRSILAALVDEDGEELPVGLRGQMGDDESQPLMLGFGGMLFIERAEGGELVTIEREEGPCAFRLPQELPTDNAGRLGKVTCESL